jgi:hypothetical protein
MNQGLTRLHEQIRSKVRLPNRALATASLAVAAFVTAMFVAACGGGGSVPHQSVGQLMPRFGNCTQSGQMSPAFKNPPIGQCSPPPQWQIIVANPGNNTATSYQFTTSGNATPLATLTSTANQLNGDYGIYFDGDTGDFFIANANTNSVNRYQIGCLNGGGQTSGCPDQTLSGSNTGLNAPYGMTENYLDFSRGDEPAYTLNIHTPSIVAQLENQAGNATPLYTIKGSNTQLNDGQGLAVDSSHSANSGAIYADSYTGAKVMMWLPSSQFPTPTPNQILNIAPKKVISGLNTGITHPYGLYVDVNGYLYVVNRNPDKIIVFSPSATGNATPSNTITASLSNPYGVSVYTDLTVYVTNVGPTPSVNAYSNGETGTSTLLHSIAGSNTGLNGPANLDVRISR